MIVVGQLVQKSEGYSDIGKIGVVCEIIQNDIGHRIFKVLVEGEEKLKAWYSEHVKPLGN